MSNICRFVFIFVVILLIDSEKTTAQQAYCWDPCQLDCTQTVPRLCPPENILTYYDCCPDGCCQYIKWPNLLFLMFIVFLLMAGCCCCAFFLLTDARQRMFQKQQRREEEMKQKAQKQNHTAYPSNGIGAHAVFKHKKHSAIV